MQKIWNRDFVKVCFSSLFLFLTFYILVTTLPIFVLDTLHGGEQQIGLVMTAFVIGAVVARPFAGKWADGAARRKILVSSLIGFLLFSCLYLVSANYSVLLVLRFLHGITFGIGTTVLGAIAIDLIPAARKGEGIGYYSMFMSIAMVAGPFLGLTILNYASFTVLFSICLTFSLLSAGLGLSARIPKRPAHKTDSAEAHTFRLTNYIEVRAIPVALAGMVLAFVYAGILTFLSPFAREIHLADIANLFFVVYAVAIIISRPFTGRLYDRRGANKIVYPGIILFAIGVIALSMAHSSLIFLAAGVIIGLGYGSIIPSFQTLAVQSAAPHRGGLATGTYFLFFDFGVGVGSTVLGMIAAHMSYRSMYVVSAFIVLFSGIVYYFLQHQRSAAVARRNILQQNH